MCKLFRKSIVFLASKETLRLAVFIYITTFAVASYSQALFDPANLIFEITLPTDNSIEITVLDGATNEENIALVETIDLYEDSVDNIQLRTNNPYDYELLEEYTSLGDAYRSLGRHEAAISSFNNAIQITKVQNGLYNLDQLPLLEKIIQSYLSLGDIDNAMLSNEYSHYLHLENYNATDPEMIEATFALTQWYIAAFFRSNFQSTNQKLEMVNNMQPRPSRGTSGLAGSDNIEEEFMANPNQAMLDNILNGNVRELTPRDIEHPLMLRIGNIYEDLQNNIYADEQPDIGAIVQTARRVAELSFITKQEMDFERQSSNYNVDYVNSRQQEYRNSQQRMDRSYDSGRNALQYIVSLLRNVETRPGFLASAIVELGDWHLAYGKITAADDAYQEVYNVMDGMGIFTEAADVAFNEPVPYQIPRMATHMFTRRSAGVSNDVALNYQGYVDVSFTIDSQGNADEITFLENNTDEALSIQNFIFSSLRLAKFRPHFNNSEMISSGQMNLRYYYAY